MSDIQDHYELVEVEGQQLLNTYREALAAAQGDPDRVWFVRHGDAPEDGEDEVWDVELAGGQFVNNIGFFVSVDPCRDEDRTAIFTY